MILLYCIGFLLEMLLMSAFRQQQEQEDGENEEDQENESL